LSAREDELPMRPHLAGVDRRIGAVERVEQLVAELGHEVLQAEREGGSGRFEQVALHSGFGNGFKIEGHGDAPEQWGMHLPHGAMTCPGWEECNGARPLDADQYSLGSSSVVTLRSHSVMIQSFRSRVTW
jgi:hypothetical protein